MVSGTFSFGGWGGRFLFRKQGVKVLPAAAKVQDALSSENRHEIQVVTHVLFLLLNLGDKKPQPGPFGFAVVFLSGRISVFVLDGSRRGALAPGDFCSYLGRL